MTFPWNKGQQTGPRSDETRDAIAAGARRRYLDPEERARMSAATRGKHGGNRSVRSASVKGECAYCGRVAHTMDHVVPRPPGHGHKRRHEGCDRVPACWSCNRSKQDRTPEQWLADGLYSVTDGGGQ